MADARHDPTSSPPESPEPADAAPASDGTVELSGHLDEGPVGVVRLFEDAAHLERYVDIKLKDVVRLFPESAPDAASGVTVIAVRGDAILLISQPVAAQALSAPAPEEPSPEEPSTELKTPPVDLRKRKWPPPRLDHPQGWPRRGGA